MRSPRARRTPGRRVLAVASVAALAVACAASEEGRVDFTPPATPEAHAAGETFFRQQCALCHGVHATGTDSGPPLVHPNYRPAHHADQAFVIAIRSGVAAHHWRFGNMPAQPQVPDSQVAPIIGYVRWLQEAAGIR